jgi:hypothetical protein
MKNGRARFAVFAALFLCFTLTGCTAAKTHRPEGENGMTDKKILVVLERHKNQLMAIPGVVGVAEGRCNGKPCIKVYVIEKTPETAGKIPSRIEGFPVSVEETGEFKPLPEKGD